MRTPDLTKRVMALLWSGKADEARALLASERKVLAEKTKDLERRLQELEVEKEQFQAALKGIEELMPSELAVNYTNEQPAPEGASDLESPNDQGGIGEDDAVEPNTRLTAAERRKRRITVLEVARKLARSGDGRITPEALASALAAQGVEMGVSDSIVRTALGNILFKSEEFTRLDKGVFEFVAQPNLH